MIIPSFGLTVTERVLPKLALDWTTGLAQPGVDVARAGVATYTDANGIIQLASADTQRVDWTTGTAGLLVEEARTNIITYSDDFRNTATVGSTRPWSNSRITVSLGATTSPDGLLNANKLTENNENNLHLIQEVVTVTNGATYTLSIFVKKAERSYIELIDAFSLKGATFNLNNGTVSAPVTGGISAASSSSITNVGNGWYRCSFVTVAAGTSLGLRATLSVGTSVGNTTYQGDGSSGLYAWRAQIEAGAFATSSIPTTTTAVTRNADVATMTGTNFSDWFNPTEGTFVATVQAVGLGNPFFTVSDGTVNNRMLASYSAVSHLYVINGGVGQANLDAGTIVANQNATVCCAYKANNFGAALDGGATATDLGGTIPTVNKLSIATDQSGVFGVNGVISKLQYYRQRLTNNEIRAFSKG